jgi:hypothetical protein
MIEWVPDGQTVNQMYYLEVLTKLRERVRKERPGLWKKIQDSACKQCTNKQRHRREAIFS